MSWGISASAGYSIIFTLKSFFKGCTLDLWTTNDLAASGETNPTKDQLEFSSSAQSDLPCEVHSVLLQASLNTFRRTA